ncbi:synaptotagmin-10 [Rhinolophus sinicus]|uniref:Synaptotagmin 10 n=1 Tax=Rhinolophus ferrumequinum TaxID=59479 RepID=A0A671DZL3_RHIFE|nr:PREDICTED: synaptotagmin-10 [Rhinolophus sinicus]XP_032973318.1 synaptotagmin-10 [Rhinolophus ferrumequinum]KAF6340569.1 synaptotagmin 10 [Rhinolophus ferrumequinum]
MSFHKEDGVSSLCQKALHIVTELCFAGQVEWEKCSGIFPPDRGSQGGGSTDISVSLLAVVVSFCGLALLVVSLFVFWKLCWPCWKSKPVTSNISTLPQSASSAPTEVFETEEKKEVKENGKPALKAIEPAIKISHTSPDIPAEVQTALKEHLIKHARVQRQTTEPTSSSRHNSFRRHLPRQMQVSSVDFSMGTEPIVQRGETTTSIGRIKPELYKQKSVDSEGNRKEDVKTCGKLNFTLQYDYENELLVVKIIKALDLPAKDFTGTSDPYVKMYLLPDRKKKYQTRVHRKTLNPLFDETFHFPVAYDQLSNRKLHFSVYDFDRFSRHDMIGEVIVDNLFEVSDLSREATVWKDIHCATTESIDLGEIMFSLCYLPTAGRMTLTVIKCRNLKAMDITGASDPYVKVSLMCEGRRLKKRKTTTKKNTLNPVYNEAIIFDIPPENVEQVSLSIAVMDYDRVGHNEVIGVCRTGLDAKGLGRDHWNEMLAYHRKPITHWHPLLELPGRASSFDSQGSCPSPKQPSTP